MYRFDKARGYAQVLTQEQEIRCYRYATLHPQVYGDLSVDGAGYIRHKTRALHRTFNTYTVVLITKGLGTYSAADGPRQELRPGSVFSLFPGTMFHTQPDEGQSINEIFVWCTGPGVERWIVRGLFPIDCRVREVTHFRSLERRFRRWPR